MPFYGFGTVRSRGGGWGGADHVMTAIDSCADIHVIIPFINLFLLFQGYKPTIFYPKRTNKPLYDNLFKQCEGLDMPVLSFFPSEAHLITDSYNFVVDALFGFSFKRMYRKTI